MIYIVNRKKILSITEEQLLRLEHHPGSWRFGSSAPGLRVCLLYGRAGHPQKAEIVLAADDPGVPGFLDYIHGHFPDQSCLGPNESEKEHILSRGRRGVYSLHALHILTPAGISLGILLVCVLILFLILAESMPVRSLSDDTMRKAILVFLGMALIPAALMTLVLSRRLMVLRTDPGGLTVRRLFGRTRFAWQDVTIGEPRPDAFNVYTGMFCYYSDRIYVVSSRSLVEIPLLDAGTTEDVLRMNLEEAGPLFRELYYRGKVTLETARKIGAFL